MPPEDPEPDDPLEEPDDPDPPDDEPEEPDMPDDPDVPDEPDMPPEDPDEPEDPLRDDCPLPLDADSPLSGELPELPLAPPLVLDEPDALRAPPELDESLAEPLRPLLDCPSPCDELPRSRSESPDEPLDALCLPDEPETFWSRSAMVFSSRSLWTSLEAGRAAIPRALPRSFVGSHNKCQVRFVTLELARRRERPARRHCFDE